MAVIGKMINPDIEYGNPTDIRMDNGNTGIFRPPIGGFNPPPQSSGKTGVINLQLCPNGGIYLGTINGVPKCLSEPKRYRDVDKQAAFEKAKADGIRWTGQYTKNETTGEVIPKPLEQLIDEAKSKIDGVVEEPNLLKKYWWVLAAVGVYLIISND
jgi:hypothetical protein